MTHMNITPDFLLANGLEDLLPKLSFERGRQLVREAASRLRSGESETEQKLYEAQLEIDRLDEQLGEAERNQRAARQDLLELKGMLMAGDIDKEKMLRLLSNARDSLES